MMNESSYAHSRDDATADGLSRSLASPDDVEHAIAKTQSNSSSEVSGQTGVKVIEAVAQTWSTAGLIIAYLGIFLLAFSTSIESLTSVNLLRYATSAFDENTFVSTVGVIGGVVLSIAKPLSAKIADVFGRLEGFCLAILLYILGYVQQAASRNIATFASAQIFYSAGSSGLQILIQIFIADTSNLMNRALFSALPETPFLVTTWVGPIIAGDLVPDRWRWGYGLWAMVLPAAFLPFCIALAYNQHKAAKLGLYVRRWKQQSAWSLAKEFWFDLDLLGLMLLSAAVALILLPLTLAQQARGGWSNPSMIAMIVLGCVFLVAFPLWERSKTLAPKAFFPPDLFKQRTIIAGVTIAFFYYMAFYLSVFPYFSTYLEVVNGLSATAAGHVTSTFSFTSTVAAVGVGLLIKYTGHLKYFITTGSCIYLMGIGLMIRYRTPTTSVASLVGTQIAVGIGGGMLNVPVQLAVQASASHQEVAGATAVYYTILEIGGAVGQAVSGAIWSSYIPSKLVDYLPPGSKGDASAIFASITTATSYADGTAERAAIIRAYQETMNTLLIIAICMSAVIVPLSLFIKNYELASMDQKVKGRVIGGVENTSGKSEEQNPQPPEAPVAGMETMEQQAVPEERKTRGQWPFSMFRKRHE